MNDAFAAWLRSHRLLLTMAFDAQAWIVAIVGFSVFRYELAATPTFPWTAIAAFAVGAALLHLILGSAVRLHHGRAATGSHEEMILLGVVTATTGLLVTAVNLGGSVHIPRTVPVAATFIALVLMAWGRAVYRQFRQRGASLRGRDTKTRAVIVGAGEGGRQLIASMLREPNAQWQPAALVDDDPLKRHRRIRGVPVLGMTDKLADVAERVDAGTVILAIPSATAELIRELSAAATAAGLDVKVIPGLKDLFSPSVSIADVRDIDITDLLGRRQIDTDIASIASYLTGKRILVTGAGGSIGSELSRQIAQFGPAELIMLDRDESALHAVQLSIYGRAMLDTDDVVLGDIRDTQFMNTLFETRKPHVVFHAAALKHLPMLEQYPGEAIKTNVWGTLTILEAAKNSGVEKFVNISTDKAANPTSVLGYSKRLAEGLTAAVAQDADGTYLSVRFGNVLGSRGSVLTAFTAQIAAGGPVTVTHPEVTRFFMTVQEAVQLLIQAAAIGCDGEALVLEMGEPVSIDSVARQLIELSGKPIEVVYTGLRDGEKMHEELFGDSEPDKRPVHSQVAHVEVPALSPYASRELDPWGSHGTVIGSLKRMTSVMRAPERRKELSAGWRL